MPLFARSRHHALLVEALDSQIAAISRQAFSDASSATVPGSTRSRSQRSSWSPSSDQAFATVIGLAAAVCTTGANLPQLKKAWTTRQTDDISMYMLLVLASGLALWVAYGVLQKDIVIILANAISLALIGGLVCLNLLHTSS
jgi:MtN3 and saliva related transmembrane protein